MYYKQDIDEVMERYQRFYAPETEQMLMVLVAIPRHILVPAEGEFPRPNLNKFDLVTEHEQYVDEFIKYFCSKYEIRRGIKDDFVPAIFPYYGIAQSTVYLCGNLVFGEESSWVYPPPLDDWEKLENISFDRNNEWFKFLLDGTKMLKEKSNGSWVATDSLDDGPFDIAHTLRGNDFFYDLYDHPGEVTKLCEITLGAFIEYKTEQRTITGDFCGGHVAGWGVWMPGDTLFIAEDNASLISPEQYAKFSKPVTQKVIDNFGGGYMHTHVNGMHVVAEMLSLDGLKMMQISQDDLDNAPRVIDNLPALLALAQQNNVGLDIQATPKEIAANIEIAKKGKVFFSTWADTVDEANRIVEFIRKHSPN